MLYSQAMIGLVEQGVAEGAEQHGGDSIWLGDAPFPVLPLTTPDDEHRSVGDYRASYFIDTADAALHGGQTDGYTGAASNLYSQLKDNGITIVSGNRIGVLVDFAERTVHFYCNGSRLGPGFRVPESQCFRAMVPAVLMRRVGDTATLNTNAYMPVGTATSFRKNAGGGSESDTDAHTEYISRWHSYYIHQPDELATRKDMVWVQFGGGKPQLMPCDYELWPEGWMDGADPFWSYEHGFGDHSRTIDLSGELTE
jgi:hypothetical protein